MISSLWMMYKRWTIRRGVRLSGNSPIVGIGDSWLNLIGVNLPSPIDMIDWMRSFGVPVIDGATPGYTIKRERSEKLYESALRYPGANAVILLSLGGNDLIASPSKMLSDPTRTILDTSNSLRSLIADISGVCSRKGSSARIFIHGYDYVHAEKSTLCFDGSLTSRFHGTPDGEINSLMRRALDLWNDELLSMQNDGLLSYVDLRGTLSSSDMMEDIHASPIGAMKLAVAYLNGVVGTLSKGTL